MLELSDNAVREIKELTESGGLRSWRGEGEEGSFTFDPSLADEPEEGDVVVERDGARVFLDALAAEKLADVTLEIESHGDHVHFDFVRRAARTTTPRTARDGPDDGPDRRPDSQPRPGSAPRRACRASLERSSVPRSSSRTSARTIERPVPDGRVLHEPRAVVGDREHAPRRPAGAARPRTCVAAVLERVPEQLREDERQRRRAVAGEQTRARATPRPRARRRRPARASRAAGRAGRRGRRRRRAARSAPRARPRSRGCG